MAEPNPSAPHLGGGKSESGLCKRCLGFNHYKYDLNGHVIRLCVEGSTLTKRKVTAWGGFLEDVLMMACAARNTHLEGCPCWVLLIHINNPDSDVGYHLIFSERLTDKLKPMTLGSEFSDIFHFNMINDETDHLSFLNFTIFPDQSGIAAKNLRSDISYNHCLQDSDPESILKFLFCGPEVSTDLFTGLDELRDKKNGDEVPVHENASVQLKSLQPKENKENMRKSQQPETFHPKEGKDYVSWLWIKQTKTLGQYISAFAKKRSGGAFYCGVKEDKSKNKIHALSLSEKWKQEMQEGIEEKIKEDMLWVQRDPKSDNGYKVLESREIEKGRHFDVEFIPVTGPSTEESSLYILEVRVASFNGVVFNHKGPEVYEFKEDGHSFAPARVEPLTWLQNLQKRAWCPTHRTARKLHCGRYDKCQRCKATWSKGCSKQQSYHGPCKDHPKA